MQLKSFLGENRAEYIASKQGTALMKAYDEDTGPGKPKNLKKPESILKVLVTADPTPNQRHIQWITTRYVHKDFSLEDVQRVKQDLSDFVRVRNRLKVKDLNAYSVDELYKAMEPLLLHGSSASMKRHKQLWQPTAEEQKMVDAGHVRLVYQDDQIRVFVPNTFEASCHFGAGTKWCTTWKDSPSHFLQYQKDGPLYIIDTPDGKFQFHFEHNQFMNDKDRPAELGALIDRYPQLQNVFHELAQKHGVLGLLKNPTQEAMLASVVKRPDSIKKLRATSLNAQLVQAAMHNVSGYQVDEVFGYLMKFRPDLITSEIKLLAIKAKPSAVKTIPKHDLTLDQVRSAMKGDKPTDVVDAFKWVEQERPDLITNEVREDVLKKDGSVLSTIGKKATTGMIQAALSDPATDHSLAAFKYAMEHLSSKVTDDDIKTLVSRTRHALEFVPEKRQTDEIVKAALHNDVAAFVHVKNATPEIIAKAVAAGAFVIKDNKYLRDLITTKLMIKAAKMNPEGMAHELGGAYDLYGTVPHTVDLNAVLKACMKENGLALEYIKPEKQTPELIKAAVEQNPAAWAFANKHVIKKDSKLYRMYKEH